jgi:hypothetical protein
VNKNTWYIVGVDVEMMELDAQSRAFHLCGSAPLQAHQVYILAWLSETRQQPQFFRYNLALPVDKKNCNETNIEHARLLPSFERHFSKLTFNYYNQANLGLFLPSNRKRRLVTINIVPGHLIHISMVA